MPDLPVARRVLEDTSAEEKDHEDRNLQLTIVTPSSDEQTPSQALASLASSSSTTDEGVKLQILFFKNLKDQHSTTLYSETQSATLASDFSSNMGNYLKDHPLILSFSPLISFQHDTPSLYGDTRVYNLRGNETIQITELTAFNTGFIYGMILYREIDAVEDYITPMHIKRSIDIRNETALHSMRYIVDDLTGMVVGSDVNHFTPGSKIWINIADLPWNPDKLRRNLQEEEKPVKEEHSVFEKVAFFLSEKLSNMKSRKTKQAIRKLQTSPEDRKLQIDTADISSAAFDSSIFWENTLPNPNITEYTFYYVATDQRANDWTQHSEVKKIQFTLYGDVDYDKTANILIRSISMIMAIFGLNFILG